MTRNIDEKIRLVTATQLVEQCTYNPRFVGSNSAAASTWQNSKMIDEKIRLVTATQLVEQ
jgi:hypothetical protein